MKRWRISYLHPDGNVGLIVHCRCPHRPTLYAQTYMTGLPGCAGYRVEVLPETSLSRTLGLWSVVVLALLAACLLSHPGQQIARSSVVLAAASVARIVPAPVVHFDRSCHAVITTSLFVKGPSSLCPAFMNRVLSLAGSPATGLGQDIYTLSTQYGVDDAYTLAFYAHESTFGRFGAAAATKSWGNINCTPGWPTCIGRFRSYPTIRAGLEDYLRLLTQVYFPAGRTTAATIIPMYAPTADNNNEASYIGSVNGLVRSWRAGSAII